jgi:hypothetical protein
MMNFIACKFCSEREEILRVPYDSKLKFNVLASKVGQ